MHRKWFLISLLLAIGLSFGGIQAASMSPAKSLQSALLGDKIVISALSNRQKAPAVAFNSKHGEYLVVWHNLWSNPSAREIWASRVSSQGTVIADFKVGTHLSPNDNASPAVAYDPRRDRYLVVWSYDYNGDGSDWDISGRFIPWDGPDSNLAEFTISNFQVTELDAQVVYAYLQDEFLVAWDYVDTANFQTAIYARRVFANGSGFPGFAFEVASSPTQPRVDPALAYNNSQNEYIVTYDNGFDIFGTLIDSDGHKLGSGEFPIAGWPDAETLPAVASCPGSNQYLVLWQSFTTNGDYDIFARFLSADGSAGAVLTVHNEFFDENYPHVTCLENNHLYLAAWEQRNGFGVTAPNGIWARTIDPGVAMQPDFEITPSGVFVEQSPSKGVMALDNGLTVWERDREGTTFSDIHGRLFWPYGAFLPIIMEKP